ncbi:MAG: type II toxin-antitoxin system YafQ family toxin [Desulfobacterales bacterium]|nr:type II toxin-antitoxin system YafQ family toxin [Desulfobacterales bacterium]
MRTIERASAFKRDYKKVKTIPKHQDIDLVLSSVLSILNADKTLPKKYRDHPLYGDFFGYRECHIKPDLLLIYSKSTGILRLARLGSHSELFG